MANRIQLRRDTTINWNTVNPVLSDGEPGLETDTNKIKYGDGSTAWLDLAYASGGGGLTDVDGVVTFPGDLLIGTLWPEDPINGMSGDKESVVWAKDDTEYLGLWWGGDQTYPEMGYGPVAGIMIGAYDLITDDFTNDPSPADTNVTIGINDSNGDTLEWRFDRTGNLTLPEGSTITDTASAPGNGNGQAIEIKPGGANNVNQLLKIYPTVQTPDGNHLHLTSGDLSVTDLFLGDDDQFVQIAADGNVCIGTNSANHIWQFDNTGNLTLPTGTTISETTEIVSVTLDQFTDGGYPGTQVFTKVSNTRYELSPGGPYMELVSSIWRLKISVSTYYSSTDLITWEAVAGAAPTPVGTLGTLATMSLTANSNSWAFNGNGNLTFPDSTTQSTAFNIAKFGEGFSLNGADKIVTNKLYSTNASSPTQHYRLELDTNGVVVLPDQSIINGSTIRGIYGTGELNYTGITIGPDTNHREESWVWVDHTGVSIATEYSTDAYTWKFDNNGSLTLPSDGTITSPDDITLLANQHIYISTNHGSKTWDFDGNGNLTLPTGGEIHSAAGTGSVAIEANDGNNTRTWTFGTDGSLTFPDTTIQNTAYKRTTGSWTVATGSGSYSFTVPLNGTYAMWVKGNIDNGIIVWNATATVTNNNVPVIGQQFAWNYTGAGTPIEITAMPTQFVGTGNVIVSSNPSVGTSSNVFNFTINNDSGSAQIVYWGYVAQ